MKQRVLRLGMALLLILSVAIAAQAAVVDMTGGTIVTPGTVYQENGFQLTVNGGGATFGQYLYSNGNDVVHTHWLPYGATTSIVISKVGGGTFDLNYFVLTSNTQSGGGPASGNELTYITASNGYKLLLPPVNWGTMNPPVRVDLGPEFDGITSATFTVESSVYCFGMDSFYIDEPAPPPPGQSPVTWHPTSGLVASYPFNGNADDASGNGNHGTVAGATLTADRFATPSTAYNFDGNDRIDVLLTNNIPVGNSPYSISTWIKPVVMGDLGIIGWGEYGMPNAVNALRLTSSGLVNYWWDNDLQAFTSDLANTWHQVTVTYDGTTRRLYLDGEAVVNTTTGPANILTSNNFAIGRTAPDLNEYFVGVLDDILIYNRALTAGEVAGIFNNVEPPSATFLLTVNKGGAGSGSIQGTGISCGADCSENFAANAHVDLTATPDAGYGFTGWSGACTGTGLCEVTMDAAKDVTATFVALPPCGAISGLYVYGKSAAAVADGTYRVYWEASYNTPNATYVLYENDVEIYRGPNRAVEFASKPNGSYSYTVKAVKDGYAASPVKDGLTVTVNKTCMPPVLYGPTSSTTGSYRINWRISTTPGVTYVLTENGTEIYRGTGYYKDVTKTQNDNYVYVVKAIRAGYNDSTTTTLTTAVNLVCGSIAGLYGPTANTTGSYRIYWEASAATTGATYVLYENGVEVYRGLNRYKDFTNKPGSAEGINYSYTVQAVKGGFADGPVKGTVTTKVIR